MENHIYFQITQPGSSTVQLQLCTNRGGSLSQLYICTELQWLYVGRFNQQSYKNVNFVTELGPGTGRVEL
jgi:hypothetical protein